MRILYFAWLREQIGQAQEEHSLPAGIDTPRALINWLRTRSPTYDAAFADITVLRCAVNQEFCSLDARLDDVTEIAFFPPMTGG